VVRAFVKGAYTPVFSRETMISARFAIPTYEGSNTDEEDVEDIKKRAEANDPGLILLFPWTVRFAARSRKGSRTMDSGRKTWVQ